VFPENIILFDTRNFKKNSPDNFVFLNGLIGSTEFFVLVIIINEKGTPEKLLSFVLNSKHKQRGRKEIIP